MKSFSPADLDITWGDVKLAIAGKRTLEQQAKALMKKFYIPSPVAIAWVEKVRQG